MADEQAKTRFNKFTVGGEFAVESLVKGSIYVSGFITAEWWSSINLCCASLAEEKKFDEKNTNYLKEKYK